MNNISQKLSIKEKIGYSLGDLAANLVFQTLMTYLAYFYTDIYGLSPTDSSIIMLIVGLIAAFVFNPIIGVLADRTRTKWGKFRPWILLTAVPLGVVALLAFSTPDFSYNGKVIYAVVTYTFLLLFYAGNNLPYSALSGVITGNMAERNSMSSYRFVAVMFAQFFVQVFMLGIIKSAGNGDKAIGIEKVMTVLAIIGTIMLLITFLTTKERIIPKPEQKSSIKEDLSDLVKNRPWIIMLTLTTLVFITLAMKGGSYVYYFENYVNKQQLEVFIQPILDFLSNIGLNYFGSDPIAAGFGLFNAGGIIFMIVGITLSKNLADKYGKRNVFGLFLFISTLFIIAFYFFAPTSISLIFFSQILHGFFYGITIPILWAMIADVADYSEWLNNRRATAIIFSAMMVGLKAGLSIGGALTTLFLGYFNYIPNTTVQTETAISGIKLLVSVFPAIPFLIGAGLLFFYKINKQMEIQIETELKERRT
ncbi:MFS transporter [Flavobacterium reichenbachii]|uniref:Transporter n=1 Tax=Flavobacterium reichenbachii TaxID=362418 RepID=A0A085ZMK8_9FLAO|nr:MFS transporter [Flavobacterium reichenbachii]KFF05672.1 transporter [Flavobacterium reichenbachii]OXB18004.1 MFS transporter [Flavobacterium reichenbachii]